MSSILFDDLNDQEFQEALDIMYQNDSETKITNLFEQSFESRLESNKKLINEDTDYYLTEEAMKRSQLPDSMFGVPEQRKYPLDTEKHVRSAIKLFNYVDPKYEEQLANNIKKKMKEYDITDINVGEANRFSKYYHPDKKAVNEGWLVLDPNGKWTLADNYEDYEKYYNPSKLNESYYTKKDILLEELGEFLLESGDKIKYIEKDSKVIKMPKVCPKCGSKMGIFLQGEPVCLCTNKDCKYYAGTVCFDQKAAAKKFNESTVLSEAEDVNVKDKFKTKIPFTAPPTPSEDIQKALISAENIPNEKTRSSKIREIISSNIGKLCAKIKHILGNLRLYDDEYTYDGYIRKLFPKYLDMLNAKDMYKLKQSIMEHAFTTGIGHKSLSDVMKNNRLTTDKDNYLYNLTDTVRKDLSVFLHTLDAKYEKMRFDGSKPYKKEEQPEEPTPVKTTKEETPKKEEPKKKRRSYWDVDVSEEEEEELSHESAEVLTESSNPEGKELDKIESKLVKIMNQFANTLNTDKSIQSKLKEKLGKCPKYNFKLVSKRKGELAYEFANKSIEENAVMIEYLDVKLLKEIPEFKDLKKQYNIIITFGDDDRGIIFFIIENSKSVKESTEVLTEGAKLPKKAKAELEENMEKLKAKQGSVISGKKESKAIQYDFKSKGYIPVAALPNNNYLVYIGYKNKWCIVNITDDITSKLSDRLKYTLESAEILEEKAKIKSDDPDDAGYFKTNIKIKGANVVVCSRYHEEAEDQIKSMGKAFKNVEKSYSSVVESVANEIYNEWSKDHGEKLSRKDFIREIFKSKLQNRVIAYKDDYGFVFEFNYSINPVLGGKILNISIYTDLDGLVSSYKYELESTVRRY